MYLQEFEYNVDDKKDPESFKEAMSCSESNSWYSVVINKMNCK